MFRLAVVSMAVADAREYAKGFVRGPRNAAVQHATITEEMRAAAPDRLDWTETLGAVSAVKDQGQCGSCWAFSATEGIESGVFMTDGTAPPPLSPQQMVSCDERDSGCQGGNLESALAYVQSAGGLDTEDHYPYNSYTGDDHQCISHENVVTLTDYKYAVPPCESGLCKDQDEDGLKAALNTFGPLSVCVNAARWSSYEGGVLSVSCSGAIRFMDHCVQLVGYDTTASTPYWKVKNSWSTEWGESGFMRLPMGENACGIANEAMYVTASMTGPLPPPRTPPPTTTLNPPTCGDQFTEDDCNNFDTGLPGLPCYWCHAALGGDFCMPPFVPHVVCNPTEQIV